MVKVARSRRSTRSSPASASCAPAAASSTRRGNRRRRPRSSISPSSTSRATWGLPSLRSTRAPALARAHQHHVALRAPAAAHLDRARRAARTAARPPGTGPGGPARPPPGSRWRSGRPRALRAHPRDRASRALGRRLVAARLGVVGRLHRRLDAHLVDVLAAGQEVLAHGDVQHAAVGQRQHLLEDALAEGARAHHRGPVAVAQRARDDLRGRRRAAVDQHHHGHLGGDRAALGVEVAPRRGAALACR